MSASPSPTTADFSIRLTRALSDWLTRLAVTDAGVELVVRRLVNDRSHHDAEWSSVIFSRRSLRGRAGLAALILDAATKDAVRVVAGGGRCRDRALYRVSLVGAHQTYFDLGHASQLSALSPNL